MRWSHRGRRWQYGACALHAVLVRLYACKHTPAPLHPNSHTKNVHARTPKHTLKICNIYCCSTTTMVTWTRLSVTLYVHCLSCLLQFVLKTLLLTKSLMLRVDSSASSGGEGNSQILCTSLGLSLRQHCQFQHFVSYLVTLRNFRSFYTHRLWYVNLRKKFPSISK
jgi:hypothetical protein